MGDRSPLTGCRSSTARCPTSAHDAVRGVRIDVLDLATLIEFWSAALGYELAHGEQGYAVLRAPADVDPRLFLQLACEPKLSKNGAHTDVEVADERSAVDLLVGIGTRVLWGQDFVMHHWTVLADPEGTSSA